jgi:hypothetical protein
VFYKYLFLTLGVKFWLSVFAVGLALVSTAGIFPEFVTAGSIDLYLSKPIGRTRLFLTRYVGGLMFVALQVTAFCVASFVVIGMRGGAWEPAIFLAVPLVVLVFSYLFAVCVLLGLLTRSTVAALLLTLLFWFILWASNVTELGLLNAEVRDHLEAQSLDAQIAQAQAELRAPASPRQRAATAPFAPPTHGSFWERLGVYARAYNQYNPQSPAMIRQRLRSLQADRAQVGDRYDVAHRIAWQVKTVLPKTSETIDLLERELIRLADLPQFEEDQTAAQPAPSPTTSPSESRQRRRERYRAAQRQVQEILRHRSVGWVLGTSLAFETVIVALGGWIFWRRDY